MNVGVGIGLAPADSCYDANRAWYEPDWWMTDAECACVAAQDRPLGEQCASFVGTTTTMAGQAGGVLGGASSAIGEGIGSGAAAGLSNFGNSLNFTGFMLLAVVGMVIYAVKR